MQATGLDACAVRRRQTPAHVETAFDDCQIDHARLIFQLPDNRLILLHPAVTLADVTDLYITFYRLASQ